VNREQIMAALVTLVEGSAGFVSVERRLKHWAEVAAKPALCVDEPTEERESLGGEFPTVTTLVVKLWVYVDTDPLQAPTTPLNALLDAIDRALAPPPGQRQTLGGLVYSARIGGDARQHKEDAEKMPGHGGPVAAAVIPIRILVP
jgi:hypothetical protein